MRIGRSLSPGKVFLEMNGVLRKVDHDKVNPRSSNKSGWFRSPSGSITQWGTSCSVVVVDHIIFPIPFSRVPDVILAPSGPEEIAIVQNLSVAGFELRTQAYSVRWLAVGL